MIEVVLDAKDMAWGKRVGIQRNEDAQRGGYEPAFDRDTLERNHILGARCELAFCRGIPGLTWQARLDQHRTGLPDVDPRWEVRGSPNDRLLKVRRAPAPGRKYTDDPEKLVAHVSAKHDSPHFTIWGYLIAGWAQEHVKAVDKGDRGVPAHFVHRAMLSPINPGFHDICAWFHATEGWLCIYCGRTPPDA